MCVQLCSSECEDRLPHRWYHHILPKINVNGLNYLRAKWAILCRVLHTQIPPNHGQHEDLNGQSEDKSQLYNLSNPYAHFLGIKITKKINNPPLIVTVCILCSPQELAVVVGLLREWLQFRSHRRGTTLWCSAIAPTSPVLLCLWMLQDLEQ